MSENKGTEQDRMLTVIEDPTKARILSEFWDKLENSPIEAVKLVRRWEEVRRIVEQIADSIPKKWTEVEMAMDKTVIRRTQMVEDLRDFRQESVKEFDSLCQALKDVHIAMNLVDEHTLNKLNRICDLLDRLRTAKRDGSFELLARLKL